MLTTMTWRPSSDGRHPMAATCCVAQNSKKLELWFVMVGGVWRFCASDILYDVFQRLVNLPSFIKYPNSNLLATVSHRTPRLKRRVRNDHCSWPFFFFLHFWTWVSLRWCGLFSDYIQTIILGWFLLLFSPVLESILEGEFCIKWKQLPRFTPFRLQKGKRKSKKSTGPNAWA